MADRNLPLSDVKVLDFMWVMAGPAATRVLADYGATVVRVESTKRVETARTLQPFWQGQPEPEASGLFWNMNAGKLGLTLDCENPGARDVILDLVRWADVVTESFSPRAMRKWGLDYEHLREVNPEIIMLSSCLMGQTGPLSHFAGFGNLAAALSGFFYPTGWPDRAPAGPFGAYTDYVAPRFTVCAILAALDYRRRTGKGQYIDQAQAESAMHLLGPALLDYTVNGHVQAGAGNRDGQMAPHNVYATRAEPSWNALRATDDDALFARLCAIGGRPELAQDERFATPEQRRVASAELGELIPGWMVDRWIAIVCRDDEEWRALAAAMGKPELAEDQRFATVEARKANEDELDEMITSWTQEQAAGDLEGILQAAGVPAHNVQNSLQLSRDPQLEARGHFAKVPHANYGTVTVEGARAHLSSTPATPEKGPPTFGEHTFEVLQEILGYDEARIGELAASAVLE